MPLAVIDVAVSFAQVVETVGKGADAVGVTVLIGGLLVAVAMTAADSRRLPAADLYRDLRHRLGRAILLGLELLVAADIIRPVASTPTLRTAGALGIIVVIRTVLSFSLEVELDGRWPWSKASGPPSAPL